MSRLTLVTKGSEAVIHQIASQLLKLVDVLLGLRVSSEDETLGLDLALHDERGYNI